MVRCNGHYETPIKPWTVVKLASILIYILIDNEQMKEWSNVLGLTTSKQVTNNPQSGYTQTIYGEGTSATAKLVGYSAQGVGHSVPQHPDMDVAFFGLAKA